MDLAEKLIELAADILIAALGHDGAQAKVAERAAIAAERAGADLAAAKKFGEEPPA